MSHQAATHPTSRADLRKFGLLVGGVFLALGAVAVLRHRPLAVAQSLVGLGATLALAGVAIPRWLGGVYTNWMRLAVLMSHVTTPVFMGVVYFGVVTPIGFMKRMAARKRFAGSSASTWVARPPGQRASALERQF